MTLATRPASTQPNIVIDLGDTQSRRSVWRRNPPFLSTLGLYDRSLRSLWARGASLGDLGGRIRVQAKQQVVVLFGMSITKLKAAAAWAGVFQRGIGKLGYCALSGVIAATRAIMAAMAVREPVHAAPSQAAPRREPSATSPLDLSGVAKAQKDIADMFVKAPKLPEGKPAEKQPAVSKAQTAQPAPVATKTAAPDRKPPKVPGRASVLVPSSPEKEEKTTVSVFVTRPASLANKPLHIHVAIQGA